MKKRQVVTLGSRLSKLRGMSAAEVGERLRYRVVTALERQRHRAHRLGTAPLEKHLVSRLRGAGWQGRLIAARRNTTGRFLPGPYARDQVRVLFGGHFSAERAQTLAHAADARANKFEFFGQEFHYPGDIPWQNDPVTGKAWPRVYHADVPVHGGDVGFGDVKHVWELSRQQYLIDLAKAFYLADSHEDLAAMRRLVRSWIAGNPFGTGVNWSCALEPAFRAWSWLWAYHLTADALDDEFHVEWLRSLHEHGMFLYEHLEHYTSPYNHLIGEAAALYALGACFPEFRAANAWRRRGRAVLEGRLGEQFYSDGGTAEQSTFYHHATTGFYLLAGLVARANNEELSAGIWAAIERALEFSMVLAEPDGRTPEIGGADDGKPIRMEHLPFWDFRPYQAIGAVLFARGDFKAVAGRFYEDALWLLGPQGLERFNSIAAVTPAATSVVLPHSGYAVTRSDWSPTADYVCFDVGEQAAGMRTDAVPNSMHGHADCLSVLVSLGGRRVLVDSGLYAYNCGGAWEAHFRETAAHNTARIDGRDQAKHIGKMAWSHSYRATIEGQRIDEREAWISGSHDGYARGPEGVTHRRTVWRRPGGYVLIHDEFAGSGAHEIEVNFQFAPGEVVPGEAGVEFEGFVQLLWSGTGDWRSNIRRGGEAPADGWICRSLGVKVPAPRLTLTGSMAGAGAALLSIVADRSLRPVRPAGHAGLVGLARGGDVEWITGAGLATGGPLETDGRLAVCRLSGGSERERVSAQGTFVRADIAALRELEAAAAMPVAR